MKRPTNQFLSPTLTPKNTQLGPQKVKNDPKIQSKSKVWIEGTSIENKSCSTTRVDPKTVLTLPQPKKWSTRAPNSQKWPQKTELKEL